MADKRKPNEKDYVTNKVLLVFTLCLFGVFALMLLYRLIGYGSTYGTGVTITRVVLGLGVLLLIWGILKSMQERNSGQDVAYRFVRGRYLMIIAGIVIACMLTILKFGATSIKLLYVILPVLAVYYLIYHSYPREFFVISLDCGLSAFLLFAVRRSWISSNFHFAVYAFAAIAICVAIAQAFAVKKIQNGKKIMGFVDGTRTQLFRSHHACQMMYISALILLIFVVLGAIFGPQIAYYLIFASFGYLFITAVYYTVKMM